MRQKGLKTPRSNKCSLSKLESDNSEMSHIVLTVTLSESETVRSRDLR